MVNTELAEFWNFRGFLIRTSYGWWSRDYVSVAATLFTFFKFQFAKTSKTVMLEVKIAPSKTSFLIFHWKDVARQRRRIATFKLEVPRNAWSGRSWNMQKHSTDMGPPESSLYDAWHHSQKVDFGNCPDMWRIYVSDTYIPWKFRWIEFRCLLDC